MTSSITISVIIPAWNNWELTQTCLKGLAATADGITLEVILVDNGSTDETPHSAPTLGTSLFGDSFKHLRLSENRGFAVACNQGAQAATGRYLLLLNNDIFFTSGWLPPLLKALQQDSKLIGVGPLLVFPENDRPRSGRVQHLGITASVGPQFRHLYEMFPHSHPVTRKRRQLQVITGAAMLMPTRLFHALGGFFEGFVNGMEDVDFCCRAIKSGGYFSVIPESCLIHLTSCTTGRFNHEQHNMTLLLTRKPGAQEDDIRLAAEDGYRPTFTPWLDLALKLSTEKQSEIEANWSAKPDPARLPELLQAEPLWDEGYALWTHHQPHNAAIAAELRAILCPSIDAYHELARTLAEAGHSEQAAKTVKKIALIRDVLKDQAFLIRHARTLHGKTRDQATRDALNAWLAVHDGTTPSA
ncbi:glycosyltransferase family 2 protein [Desulfovibrio ferrophilus]|uniref:Glycosyltransferase 2-like domain-containing protein n=1 Tax=Desulfovibrio ferrophilus TaxID=241368 RepID=A0A2Z6B2T2_9BACT|nr:glycosyltransferase family 2 protein [Desulfovibrio ferrophilus]BBD09720.1 uncharacterized protein DFE_2994 [Desulfovibrio ferrophilus]